MEDKNERTMIETIIEQWTEHYPPAKEEEMFTLKLTSYEIAEILSDFGTVSPGDITRILLSKGYRLVRAGDGEIKWIIKKGNDNGE